MSQSISLMMIGWKSSCFLRRKYYSSSCNESNPVGLYLTTLGCNSYGGMFGNAICSSSVGFTFTPYSYNANSFTCTNAAATSTQVIPSQCSTYNSLSAYNAFGPNNDFSYQTVECVGVWRDPYLLNAVNNTVFSVPTILISCYFNYLSHLVATVVA